MNDIGAKPSAMKNVLDRCSATIFIMAILSQHDTPLHAQARWDSQDITQPYQQKLEGLAAVKKLQYNVHIPPKNSAVCWCLTGPNLYIPTLNVIEILVIVFNKRHNYVLLWVNPFSFPACASTILF